MCSACQLHGTVHTVLIVLAVRLQSQSHPFLKYEAVIVTFRLMTDLWLACCVIKMQETSLSGSASWFKEFAKVFERKAHAYK